MRSSVTRVGWYVIDGLLRWSFARRGVSTILDRRIVHRLILSRRVIDRLILSWGIIDRIILNRLLVLDRHHRSRSRLLHHLLRRVSRLPTRDTCDRFCISVCIHNNSNWDNNHVVSVGRAALLNNDSLLVCPLHLIPSIRYFAFYGLWEIIFRSICFSDSLAWNEIEPSQS